jgi:outer membrane protein insertion porin family
VRPRADRDFNQRVISVAYVIDEGPRIYIERININGNLRTLDYVVRREFRLAEGDAYNPSMIENAKKRLQGLGFFKSVEVKRRPGSAPDRVIVDVDLIEQQSGDISFGAGYSTSEGVIGEVSLTERNLMGRGQYVRLALSGSTERLQVDLSFTEPRFLDRNLAAGFDVIHKVTSSSDSRPYEARTTGGAVRVSFPVTERLWINNSYGLSNNELSDIEDTASLAIKESAGAYWTSKWLTGFTYDTRDQARSPRTGFYLQVANEFAGLGGDVNYFRVTGEARFYYPLAKDITFVGRAQGGHITGWGGQDVRLLDLFYKGGETVRGFASSGIGPRDTLTGDALGGSTFWTTTAEVRFPFPFITQEIGMRGAVFVDAGSLFGAGQTVKSLNTQCTNGDASLGICLADSASVRLSIGASILWDSPLGPLRLDVSKALLKESYDDEQIVRFGATTKF